MRVTRAVTPPPLQARGPGGGGRWVGGRRSTPPLPTLSPQGERASWCELEPHGLADRAVTDGGHPRLVRPGELDALDLRHDRAEQRLRLHLRQRAADAAVDAVAPAERVAVVAVEPVFVGRLPESRVTVGGGEHQPAARAG